MVFVEWSKTSTTLDAVGFVPYLCPAFAAAHYFSIFAHFAESLESSEEGLLQANSETEDL
jgi:hypothetical protein